MQNSAPKLQNKVATATRWSTITEIVAKCISPIINLILARVLSPSEFGVVATVTMVVSFAEIFADAGFQKYLIQHEFENEENLNKATNVAFWTNLTVSLIIWGFIAFFNNSIAVLVGSPGLGAAIMVAAISIPIVAFSSIQTARYRKEFDFKSLFYVRLISALVPLCLTLPLALILKNYWALIIGTLGGNIVNAVILTCKSPWKPKFYYDFSLLKEIFSFSWWILLESIFVWLTSYVGTFIVGRFFDLYYVGLYKTSMTTVNQIINIVVAATSSPLFVALSKLQNEKEKMIETYYEFIKAISVFIIPLGVGIFLFRDFVTEILLGSQWGEAADFIGIWGLTSSFSLILGTYCNGLYNAVGKTYLSFFSQFLHLIVLIPVLLFSCKKGFDFLCIVRCVVRVQLIIVQLIFIKIFFGASLKRIIFGCIPAITCTIIMGCFGLILRSLFNGILGGFIGVIASVIVYFVAMYMFYKKDLDKSLFVLGLKRG